MFQAARRAHSASPCQSASSKHCPTPSHTHALMFTMRTQVIQHTHNPALQVHAHAYTPLNRTAVGSTVQHFNVTEVRPRMFYLHDTTVAQHFDVPLGDKHNLPADVPCPPPPRTHLQVSTGATSTHQRRQVRQRGRRTNLKRAFRFRPNKNLTLNTHRHKMLTMQRLVLKKRSYTR